VKKGTVEPQRVQQVQALGFDPYFRSSKKTEGVKEADPSVPDTVQATEIAATDTGSPMPPAT
jgi:hypothetical protein